MDELITPKFELFKAFAEALAIGLLLGVERYKARSPGEKGPAGVRTFALIAILGAVCGLLHEPLYTGLVFATLAGLITISYFRTSSESLGTTTEMAALLAFWLGYLVHSHETLAISVAILLTILLAVKQPLHAFVRESISEIELFDTLKFLVVVFVVYPLLPDRTIGPLDFFNPAKVWFLIILVSSISYLGYLAIRLMGPRKGVRVSSLVGGIASTVAVTLSLAGRARETPDFSRFFGVTAVTANAVQFPRLVLLTWVVSPSLTRYLLPVLSVMVVAALLGAWLIARDHRDDQGEAVEVVIENPYSFLPTLKFGLFFVGIFLLSRLATEWLGSQGILAASLVGGLASASAVALSNANLIESGAVSAQLGALGVLLSIVTNAGVKLALARLNGTPAFARWLGVGLATVIATGFATALALYWTGF